MRTLKILVAASLLGTLLYRADWTQTSEHLTRLSPQMLIGAFLALVVGLILSAWKWSYALRMQALNYPFGMLLRVLCVGFFFNSFLPTAVGGDAYRIYRTLPRDGYRSRAVAAVAVERAVGLLALLALGSASALLLFNEFAVARFYVVAIMLATAIGAAVFAASKRGWLRRAIRRWQHIAAVDALLHSIGLLRNQRANWLPLVVLSSAFQMISIGVVVALFRDLTANVGLAQCVLITAIVGVAAAAPISINGIGVTEGALVGAAVALGLDYEQALIVAIARRFIAVLLSVACGSLYLVELQRSGELASQHGFSDFLRDLRHRARGFERGNGALVSTSNESLSEPDVPLAALPPSASGNRLWSYSELLEYTNDAIIIWEMDGDGIVYWNRAAEQLYGYGRTEAHGRTTHTLLKTQLAMVGGVDQLEATLARYGVWVGELRHTTRDGRRVEVQARLALMSQHSGRWLVLEVNRDITDRKQAEAAQEAMELQLANLRGRTWPE
jgi:PAS domain S-box-containing protein